MKIKTKILTAFLKKVKMSAGQEIVECILNFSKEGLKISANSAAQQSRASGLLKSSAFTDYEEIASIGISDLPVVVDVLSRFGEDITLKVEGNLLTVSGLGKKVEIELMDVQFITSDITEPKLEFADTFIFEAEKIKEIISDAKLSKDSVLTIVTELKKVVFSNTGKYKFTHAFDMVTCKGGVTAKFGDPFVDAVQNLTEKLEFSIKTDYPIKILEKTEHTIITLIVAPRVETE